MRERNHNMRTREKKLSDYGVPNESYKEIKERCWKSTDEERLVLSAVCYSNLPGWASEYVYRSLAGRESYDKIMKKDYIPVKKDDFYGYQRKAMAAYYLTLINNGMW